MFAQEVRNHLTKDLIPFWQSMKDEENGGFYGYLGYDLTLDKKAIKGGILNSRILWFFSQAAMLLQEEQLLLDAKHAFLFLRDCCMDKEYGGVYWSVSYDGVPVDKTKHTYNQAFAIYALSSYYDATKDEQALDMAMNLFRLLETTCKDEYGYLESFDQMFVPQNNYKLSHNGVIAEKTMNTLLHVFEAYTELYKVSKDQQVKEQMVFILNLFEQKIYNKEMKRQEVFFDKSFHSLLDIDSYGHDIEAAWLLDLGLKRLEDSSYEETISLMTKEITRRIYEKAYIDHSLVNEAEDGVVDTTRVWWVQAEAVVGFLNGYQVSKESKYLEAAKDIWGYIKEYLIDKRNHSEWYWGLDQDKNPLKRPIVEPWKCPYHNGRMCFEVIRRMQDAS